MECDATARPHVEGPSDLSSNVQGQHAQSLVEVRVLRGHGLKGQVEDDAVVAIRPPANLRANRQADAPYAMPPPELGVATVRERVYRGPCRPEAEMQAFLDQFRLIRPDVSAIFDELPGLDPAKKRRALSFLDDFYRRIDRPQDVKAAFFDTCIRTGLM